MHVQQRILSWRIFRKLVGLTVSDLVPSTLSVRLKEIGLPVFKSFAASHVYVPSCLTLSTL